MYQNYPNTFNPVTSIKYDLPKNTFVTLKVYDITDKTIETIINNHQVAGRFEASRNASNFASGVYFYKIKKLDFTKVMKWSWLSSNTNLKRPGDTSALNYITIDLILKYKKEFPFIEIIFQQRIIPVYLS